MFEHKYGPITNQKGVSQWSSINALKPIKIVPAIVGGGLMIIGASILTFAAFKNGADAFELAEYKTMVDLGIIKD